MHTLKTSKWRVWVALIALVSLVAAGCSGSDDTATSDEETAELPDSEESTEEDGSEEDDSAAEEEPDESADEAPADDEARTLTIYAPWNETRAEYVVAAAADELGIEVEFLTGGGGELTDRLLAEKNNTQADVVLGMGEAQINSVASEDVFQPYEPAWSDKVPAAYVDGENRFTLFAQVPIVMSYNAAVMDTADAPTSWTDLADPAYKGQFVLPGLAGQTGQSAIAGILWRFADPETGEVSDEGWQVLTDIYANEFQVGEGEDFNPDWIADGETPIFIGWRGGVANMDNDNDAFELTIIDTEGGTPFVSTGIGITSATDSLSVAKEFVDWFGSAEFQVGLVSETGNDPPANVDAIPELETASEWLSGVTLQEIDWGVVTTVIDDWLERIELDLIN